MQAIANTQPVYGKIDIVVDIEMLSMPCPYHDAIANFRWGEDAIAEWVDREKENVGARHQQMFGEDEKCN